MTSQEINKAAQKFASSLEMQLKAEFFGRWLNVLNLTPVMDKLDEQREVNEAEAIAKRKHYGRAAY